MSGATRVLGGSKRDSVLAPEDISLHMQQEVSLQSTHCETEYVDTPYGQILVTIQGDREKPAIVTYHDIGLNHQTTFSVFMGEQDVSALASQFCWYHVDAPGQEICAQKLPEDFNYPSMTQLAEQIEYLADHFQLGYFIGLGVGAGANILARYAIINPERVSGLVLINFIPNAIPWVHPSRVAGKAVSWQLKGRNEGMSRLATYLLVRQAFGPMCADVDCDLKRAYVESLGGQNPHNLALFLESYFKRSCINGDVSQCIQCDCLFVMSSNFEHKEQVEKYCSLLDIQKTTILELSNTSGLLLDDQPTKVGMAFKLFLQGLGLVPSLSSHDYTNPPPYHHTMAVEGRSAKLYIKNT